MFELKRLHKDAVPAALAKAERYRLLNEPREAESICRDVLAADPESEEARVVLVLALTDQFDRGRRGTFAEAETCVGQLSDPYARAYYRGILHERRAKAMLRSDVPGAHEGAYEAFRQAMDCFDEAAGLSPSGEDSAILRWNTCARILNSTPSLGPISDVDEPTMLE